MLPIFEGGRRARKTPPGGDAMTTDERGRTYWDRNAKNYDRSMVLLGGPIPRMVELAGDAVRGASRVLEVAAGTGLVTPSLARSAREVVATDYAPAMVATLEARARDEGLANVRCERADLYALRFEPGSFDAVVAANVLHLVPDLPGALRALRTVLAPGGRLVVPTYCHDETPLSWMVSRALAVTGFPGHRRFTARTLREALESAGLRVARAETLRGLIPIGYVEGTFDPQSSAAT
jgi:phosphatidylethanolamine/phosphatidyl-N-methylethanolamine N-methyltransferase